MHHYQCTPNLDIVSPNDIRPKWWIIAVGLVQVILPFFFALGLYIDPEACLLGREYRGEPGVELRDEVGVAFRNVARGMAAGMLISIFMSYISITTQQLAKLRLTNRLLLAYGSFVVVNEAFRAIFDSYEGVSAISRLMLLYLSSLVLQGYMYWLLNTYKAEKDVTTLLDKEVEDTGTIETSV